MAIDVGQFIDYCIATFKGAFNSLFPTRAFMKSHVLMSPAVTMCVKLARFVEKVEHGFSKSRSG